MEWSSASPATVREPASRFRAARHAVKVRDVQWLNPATFLIHLAMDDGGPVFDFQPGQFLSIFAEKEGKMVSRPYSIASPPHEKDAVELCVRVVEGGFMSNRLKAAKPGDRFSIMAPLGGFVLQEPVETDLAFISTGTGVAPFVGMTKHMIRHGQMGHAVYMFTGVRYVKDLLYHDLFLGWEREHANFRYVPSISRPETPDWKGRVGYVQKAIQDVVTEPGRAAAYICGLNQMVDQTKELCQKAGFASVRFEKWD